MSRWLHLRSTPESNGRAEHVQLTGEAEAVQAPQVRLRAPLGAGASTLTRIRRRGPLPWIAGALILIALVGYLLVYNASTKRTPVLVTTQTLQPGSVLSSADLRVAELSGDSALLAGLIPGGALTQAVGQRLVTGLPAGTPLARSALSGESSSGAQMTLAISPLHALGGALEPGDRVTVLATFGAGGGQARTKAIARGLEVLSVSVAAGGEQAANSTIGVTVALPNPQAATALALASENGKIDLVRESASSNGAIPEASEAAGG
jgi:Flp pilus assembly protein CpaB